MSDDRFEADSGEEPEIPHIIMASVEFLLHWTGTAWIVAEPVQMIRDAEPWCSHGMHLDSAVARGKCEVERERANGAQPPSLAEIRDAFGRAAAAPPGPLIGI